MRVRDSAPNLTSHEIRVCDTTGLAFIHIYKAMGSSIVRSTEAGCPVMLSLFQNYKCPEGRNNCTVVRALTSNAGVEVKDSVRIRARSARAIQIRCVRARAEGGSLDP